MNKRLLAFMMVSVLSWMIVGPSLAAALESSNADHVSLGSHSDSVPCPDGDEEGPCDDGCPCVCCPGHAKVMFSSPVVSLESPHLNSIHRFGPPESVHPSGIHHRIFRPPRV